MECFVTTRPAPNTPLTPNTRAWWIASLVADANPLLVIDSYDSFVFNLVQYLGELGAEPIVHRNDAITVDDAIALDPDGVLLSPGPGRPEDAGILCDAVRAFADRDVPVLGVCLGHQAIGYAYGATVVGPRG